MNRQLALIVFITIAPFGTWFPSRLSAASANEAQVTAAKNSVHLENSQNAARRASVNDTVGEQTVVRTGSGSRSELTFSDQTVVRLAASTAFDFKNGTRSLNLKEGAILIQAPKQAHGATIRAGGVAAAVTGTTAMIEYHAGAYKFLVLEGTARLYRPGHLGDSVLVAAGQMVFGDPQAAVTDPVDIDIGRFTKTSHFITDFPSLRSEKSILAESQKQQREKSNKSLADTNLVIFGGGTQVSVEGEEQNDATGHTTTALAPPRRVPGLNRNVAPALP
jgi:hypothetical protein